MTRMARMKRGLIQGYDDLKKEFLSSCFRFLSVYIRCLPAVAGNP